MAWTKDQILSEIRRTAGENGERPLGKGRFQAASGIKESDWIGRFWARWSDALNEAGFAPNEMQSALSTDHLLEKMADLVESLGHYPVEAEIRLQRRSDPTFPSSNVFRRFGDKRACAQRVREFCVARGRGEAATICSIVSASPEKIERDGAAALTAPSLGYVYLIKSGRNYKIGQSNSIGRREYELGIQLPEKPTLVHAIATDDPSGVEDYWHRRFAAKRLNGEWFALNAQDVTAFRRWKAI